MLLGNSGKKTIDALSFTSEIRELCEILNRKLDQSDEGRSKSIVSHPGGFSKELSRRRLSIAESYIRVIHALESDHYEERLSALRNLIRQSFHAKTIKLPLNTARIQINLIKEAIKNRNNRRRQLELISDFGLASYGEEQVIRKLCKKFYLVEVPETGQPLKDLHMGWDYHVHDNLSEGRKTPTQVLLDAFIKGISEKDKIPISTHSTACISYFKKGSDFVRYAEQMIAKKRTAANGVYLPSLVYNEMIEGGKRIVTCPCEMIVNLGKIEGVDVFEQINRPLRWKTK